MELEVIFEDKDLIVCIKPSNVPAQSDKSFDYDMVSRVKNYRNEKGEDTYVAVINRLDRPVRGIMIFAKNKKCAALLTENMKNHNFHKFYKAIIEYDKAKYDADKLTAMQNIELEDYLLKDSKNNISKVVNKDVKGAKKSTLIYSIEHVDEQNSKALVNIKLLTGRHHQIRVQMAHAGFPLYADTKYNPSFKDMKGRQFAQIALCAYKLEITHPITGKLLQLKIDSGMEL